MSPSRLKTRPTGLLKLSGIFLGVGFCGGVGGRWESLGGFGDKSFEGGGVGVPNLKKNTTPLIKRPQILIIIPPANRRWINEHYLQQANI